MKYTQLRHKIYTVFKANNRHVHTKTKMQQVCD